MGLTSLLLRAPAVALAGGDTADEYRAGTLMCLVAAAALATWLAYRARRGGASWAAVAGLGGLLLVAILWARATFFGHPEEPLAAMLVLVAAVLARERQFHGAGIALGLAFGTKEWALLAAPAVLMIATRADWRRILMPAGVAAIVLTGVMAAGNPSSFRSAHEGQRTGDEHTITPANVWFRAGEKRLVARDDGTSAYVVYPPETVGRWCRPLVIVFALLAALLFALRRGFGSTDALALMALVLIARVVLDTQTFSYHLIPMLAALAAWEVFARRRLPVVAAAAMLAFQLTVHKVAPDLSANAFNAIFLAWTLPLAAYAAVVAFRQTLFSSDCS